MKIAAWNVNSLRVRLPHLLEWIQQQTPDVIALQEIKMPTENFPHDAFAALGYRAAVHGQKTYNGVAILSRHPFHEEIHTALPSLVADNQSRLLSIAIGDLRIVNVYVPNGEAIDSPKYVYKLQWLQALHDYLQTTLKTCAKVVVLGDFNIAPADEDVYEPQLWEGKVLCSQAERDAFQQLLQLGFSDSFRLFSQLPKLYSWWDYRAVAFRRNAGLRIDHVLLSQALVSSCRASVIDKTPRGWTQPSDHAPVMVTLDS